MSSKWIRTFEQIGKEDILTAGGKGANLGELVNAGFNVPGGFVITAEAYRYFLKKNGIDIWMNEHSSDDIRTFSAEMRKRIRNAAIPSDLADNISENYDLLTGNSDKGTAVRSSATAEDLPEASFAGQQETYLNVRGKDALLNRVRDCYASLYGDRASSYRQKQGYEQNSTALAVIVQLMAESEVSGVMFTVNPVTSDRNEIQINASYGLGESVVSGKVTPDSYLCDRSGNIKKAVIGDKASSIIYAKEGSETVQVKVPEDQRKKLCLNADQVRELCSTACRLEEHYGMPMDIEWGIAQGILYILQARAVTTLKKESPADSEWRRYYIPTKSTGALKANLSFLLEKMNEVFLPYDYDIGKIINSQKAVIFSEVGIEIDMHPQISDEGIMNLPPNSKKINRKIFNLPSVLKEIGDSEHCRQIVSEEMKEFCRERDEFAKLDFSRMTAPECSKYLSESEDYIRRVMYSRFKYAMFAQIMMDRRCRKYVKKADNTKDNYDLLQDLDNKTAEMTRDLEKLSSFIRKNGNIRQDIENGMTVSVLKQKYPEFSAAFGEFMNKNGFKTDFNCYCLYSKSYYEEPDRVLHIIRPMLKREDSSQDSGNYGRLLEQIKSSCSTVKFEKIKKDIETYRCFHVIREESQYLWETRFYYMKKLHARLSYLLNGDPDFSKCTAWMFADELHHAAEEGRISDDLQKKIEKRISLHPTAVRVWDEAKLSIFKTDGEILKGTGCSAGTAVGRACLISGPEEFWKLRKGDVLVCRLTDPEWTPLFTLASAVVADTGAELSHASIVAREYGIPAVLGTGLATRMFKDSDQIRVDGTKGEVTKVR